MNPTRSATIRLPNWISESPTRKRVVIIVLLSLLWHLAFFLLPWSEWLHWTQSKFEKERVEFTPMDAAQLEKLKSKFEKQNQQLVISKNQTKSETAPPDAKYMSDRNLRVEKEQRAREREIMPHAAPRPSQEQTEAKPKRAHEKSVPLNRLGITFNFRPFPNEQAEQTDPAKTPRKSAQKSQERQAPDQTPGGDQWIDDAKLAEGAENLLNTQESVYYSFYSRLYQAVGPIWQSQIQTVRRGISQGQYVTQVDAVFDPDGKLVDLKFVTRSGIQEFDNAVDAAWHRLPRFPNPPRDLIGMDGTVHTGWTFTVYVGSDMMQFSPPRRNY